MTWRSVVVPGPILSVSSSSSRLNYSNNRHDSRHGGSTPIIVGNEANGDFVVETIGNLFAKELADSGKITENGAIVG